MGTDMRRTFQCYAHGTDGDWEAICVDLDLAVQGVSLADVRVQLNNMIADYVASAMEEEPTVCRQLLGRRAPWHVRWGLAFRLLIYSLTESWRRRSEQQASFPVLCPA